MKGITVLFCLISAVAYSQDSITAILKSEKPLVVETMVGIDKFDNQYYINNTVLYKKDALKTINYSNLQLGTITSVDIFNALKIVVFYKDFNSVVILDNRLAEIFKIDFNTLIPYKNISWVSLGNDNTLWTFNQDLQQLELYDYKAKTVRATTLPIVSNVLDLASNYNYAWLLTEDYIYKYSYFGSFVFKIKNDGFTKIIERHDDIILQKENTLYFLNDKTQAISPIILPNLLIKQFSVTGETLYIYNSKILYEFQLKI